MELAIPVFSVSVVYPCAMRTLLPYYALIFRNYKQRAPKYLTHLGVGRFAVHIVRVRSYYSGKLSMQHSDRIDLFFGPLIFGFRLIGPPSMSILVPTFVRILLLLVNTILAIAFRPSEIGQQRIVRW